MSVKRLKCPLKPPRLLPLQPLNVVIPDSEQDGKNYGWIAIDKVCAEMCVRQQTTFITGNLKIVQQNLCETNKENINSGLHEKSQARPKPPLTSPKYSAKSPKIADRIILNGLESEDKFCYHEDLGTRSTSHITDPMRCKLLNWISEVCETFELTREVFFLSIDVLDRYLSSSGARGLKPSHFQLVGIASLFIASKYESVELCSAKKYAEMTGGAFTAQELVNMELRVLRSLDWNLNVMTTFGWLKLFLQLHSTDSLERPQYSSYSLIQGSKMLSLVLFNSDCFLFQRSLIASTVFMMLTRLKGSQWRNVTCYNSSELGLCLRTILPIIRPEIPSLSLLGHEFFKCRDSEDRHEIQRCESIQYSKQKRFCPS